jgi:hypothetical protein
MAAVHLAQDPRLTDPVYFSFNGREFYNIADMTQWEELFKIVKIVEASFYPAINFEVDVMARMAEKFVSSHSKEAITIPDIARTALGKGVQLVYMSLNSYDKRNFLNTFAVKVRGL